MKEMIIVNPFTLAIMRTVVTPYYSPQASNDDDAVAIWAATAVKLLADIKDEKSAFSRLTKDVEKDIVEEFVLDGLEVIKYMKDSSEFRVWFESESIRLGIYDDVKTMKIECVKAHIALSAFLAN
jgi:hypothetical protein